MPSEEKLENTKEIDKIEISEDVDNKVDLKDKKKSTKRTSTTFIVIIISSILTAGVIFAVCSTVSFYRHANSGLNYGDMTVTTRSSGGMRMMPRRIYINSSSTTSTETTNITTISGVVTSVSGSSFVIGGYGEATTVKTNDSTEYNTSGKKVSVNDTVMVTGTASDKVINATNVQIMNNSF